MAARWRFAQFIEMIWWRGYLSKWGKADYLRWKKDYWKQLLDRFELWPAPGSRVLDAGCGPAGVFLVLEESEVDAVDPLLLRYEQVLPHFSRSDYPDVQFFATVLERFLPEKKYDTVFCFNALNHVNDLETSAQRLSELLRPGGTLVLAIDAHRQKWLRRLFQIFPGDILHPHQHTVLEYRQLLERQGLVVRQQALIRPGRIFDYVLFVSEKTL